MKVEITLTDEQLDAIARRAAAIVSASSSPEAESGFLGVDGAAELLACPKSRVYKLVSARRIPHHKDGSRLIFDRAELRRYVESGGATCP